MAFREAGLFDAELARRFREQILGKLTPLRQLYYRELVARLAHHALLWDLSEEMDRWRYYTREDIEEICRYIKALDPYDHPVITSYSIHYTKLYETGL